MKPIIISADEIKKQLPGYNPARSDLVHRQSTKIADKKFLQALKENTAYKKVILLSGGSASGKTEYIHTFLTDTKAIILDGTLPSEEGVNIKIKAIEKYHKKVEIHSIIPDDLRRSYAAFLGRERKYDDIYFFITHSNSRHTLSFIAKKYPKIKLRLVESSYRNNKLNFTEIRFNKKKEKLDYLSKIQYNNSEIKKIVL